MWIGLLILAVGVIAAGGLAAAAAPPVLFIVFGAAMVWGPFQVIRAGRRMDRINTALMENLRENAPRVKVELDRLAYETYLRSFRASS